MTASNGERARRWDAGLVRPTERDVRVLRWLGEMYGAPLPVVAELYGVGAGVARRHAGRLHRAGFVERAYGPAGGLWLVPTRKGLHYAGLEFAAWSLAGWKAAHLAAVCRMRLHLERQYPGAGWESERQCRASWHGTGARARIPDGILGSPAGASGSRSNSTARRPIGMRRSWPTWIRSWPRVWWFVGGRDVAWLGRVLADIPCAIPQRVVELPEGVAR
jgi:hypothetical protein